METSDEILDTREAFRAESPHFGSLLGPVAKIVKPIPDDDEWLGAPWGFCEIEIENLESG